MFEDRLRTECIENPNGEIRSIVKLHRLEKDLNFTEEDHKALEDKQKKGNITLKEVYKTINWVRHPCLDDSCSETFDCEIKLRYHQYLKHPRKADGKLR